MGFMDPKRRPSPDPQPPPEPTGAERTITVLCPECGDLVEVSNPQLILLAKHLADWCPNTKGLLHE